MIETLAILKEFKTEGLAKVSIDVPNFGKELQPKEINSYKEANEPLKKEYISLEETFENISDEEKKVYEDAGLKEHTINEREVLVKEDIDWDKKDEMGRTNLERAEQGLAPIGEDGKPINLHHIDQKMDGPLAELTDSEHKENYSTLHDNEGESEISRNKFNTEKKNHWKARAEEVKMERSEQN